MPDVRGEPAWPLPPMRGVSLFVKPDVAEPPAIVRYGEQPAEAGGDAGATSDTGLGGGSGGGSGEPAGHPARALSAVLAGFRVGKPILATYANSAFLDMLLNWAAHARTAGMVNILVAALDDDIHRVCYERGIPSLRLRSTLPREDFRADLRRFQSMGALKTGFVLGLLGAGWDVLISDTDVAWVADPTEFLDPWRGPMAGADILVSSDSISHSNDVASQSRESGLPPTHGADPQAWFREATPRAREFLGNAYEHAFNTGVLLLRASPAAISFARAWHDVMRTRGKSQGWESIHGDQHAFNQLLRARMFPIQVVDPPPAASRARNNRIFWAFDRTVRLGVLPAARFCNGHLFFAQRAPQALRSAPFAVHNTFQFYFGSGKVARFREAGLWALDPPEYYNEGNFVSFDVAAPSWVLALPAGIQQHQAAMQYYYEAMRKALAVANILGRTLILPKVTCFCDRWWDSLSAPCRAPGSDVEPPFECPVDYFIDTFYWGVEPLHMAHKWRPSTFLENPRTSPAIRASRLEVQLAGREDPSSSLAQQQAERRRWGGDAPPVALAVNASDTEVLAALGGLGHIRVLHLPAVIDSFCRFEQEDANARFDWSTRNHFLLEWCCSPQHSFANFTIAPLGAATWAGCGRALPQPRH